MNDNRMLEVLQFVQKNDHYEIVGLLFSTLKIGDKLTIAYETGDAPCWLTIKDMLMYGYHLDRLDRGDKGLIIVECEGDIDIDLSHIHYLYPKVKNKSGINPSAFEYLYENTDYTFHGKTPHPEENHYKIWGHAFSDIKIGDILTIRGESINNTPLLLVKDITVFIQYHFYHVPELIAGWRGGVIVENISSNDFIPIEFCFYQHHKALTNQQISLAQTVREQWDATHQGNADTYNKIMATTKRELAMMRKIRVFEVLHVIKKGDLWEISGLAFDTLKIGDKLTIVNQTENEPCVLLIKDIIAYEPSSEKLARGHNATILLESNNEADLSLTRYLYEAE